MGNYQSTVMMVLSTSSEYNGKFLKLPTFDLLNQDYLVGVTARQGDASLFNIPYGNQSDVYGGTQAVGSPNGPKGDDSFLYSAYTDGLSKNDPLLFSLPAQRDAEPGTGELYCNVFPPLDGHTDSQNEFRCQNNANAAFRYQGFWAFCKIGEYGYNKLFFYDQNIYFGPPPGCTAVSLRVVAAPD